MSDFRKTLSELRRPPLLLRAARHGLGQYRRLPALRRLAPGETRPEHVLPRLFAAEARLEAIRQRGDAAYSLTAHVELLIALLAEMRLIGSDPQPMGG